MCAINPKYSSTLTFNIYTAQGTKEQFEKNIRRAFDILLGAEEKLNEGKLRWHLQPPTDIIEHPKQNIVMTTHELPRT